MNEEEFLRQLSLREPPKTLDGRVGEMLESSRPRILVRRIALWQCAAACVLCGLLAFMAGVMLPRRGPQKTPVSEVRWVLQVQPQPFNVFDWTQYPKSMAPDAVLQAANTGVEQTEI